VADNVLCCCEPASAEAARATMLSVQLPSVHGHRSGWHVASWPSPGASVGAGRISALLTHRYYAPHRASSRPSEPGNWDSAALAPASAAAAPARQNPRSTALASVSSADYVWTLTIIPEEPWTAKARTSPQ